jgi:hypothetical protein
LAVFSLLQIVSELLFGELSYTTIPDGVTEDIIWAIILLAFASFALIENGIALGKNGFVYENISAFLSAAVEVLVFAEYIRYAIAVKKTVA